MGHEGRIGLVVGEEIVGGTGASASGSQNFVHREQGPCL